MDRWLRTHDSTERELYNAIRIEAAEVVDLLMTNFARRVVKETAEARKRGKSSSG